MAEPLTRPYQAADDGRLAELCQRLGVVLVTVLGSAAQDAATARDLDVAVLFGQRTRSAPLELINELVVITGTEDVDLMVLDEADPIARFNATAGALPLYEDAPRRWVTRRWPTRARSTTPNRCAERNLARMARR